MKIERLEIWSRNITEQLKFYRDLLGLEISNYEEESFEINFKHSILKLTKNENATPYHIAIHVPDQQEKEALEWIKERTAVQKYNNEEIIDFSNWEAMSVYFYDAGGNIMELISRKRLFKPHSPLFTSESLLGIAEIGLATGNISEKYKFLNQNYGLEIFDGNLDKFCAVGDPEGLIIAIDKNKKDWFPTEDKAFSSEFKMFFRQNDQQHQLNFFQDKIIN